MNNRLERAFHGGFVFVLIACFTPFKVVGYLLPLVFTAWMLVSAAESVSRNKLAGLLFLAVALPVFYELVADEFLYTNYLLAVLTYSTVIPLIAIRSEQLRSPQLLDKLLRPTVLMIGIQGAIGTFQALYGFTETGTLSFSNGDRVQGTIFPYLSAEGRGANPMFAVNMAMMLLVCLARPEVLRGPKRLWVAIGAVSLVLASVLHVLAFVVGALIASYLLMRPRGHSARLKKTVRYVLMLVAVVTGLTLTVMRENVDTVGHVAESLVDLEAGISPRAILLYGVATELPDDAPHQPYVGLGPGQFSSRASLIASGMFLGGPSNPIPVPLLDAQATRLADAYCFSLLTAYADQLDHIGSSQQPFFSLLSVYTELGVLGLALVIIVVVQLLRHARRRALAEPGLEPLALVFAAGVLLLAFLGVQENYWEMPQAILVGALLLKVLYANIAHGEFPADEQKVSRRA